MGDGLSVCQSRYFCLFSAALLAARDTPHVIAGCLLSLAKKDLGVCACVCFLRVCVCVRVTVRNWSSCLESVSALSELAESAFPFHISPSRRDFAGVVRSEFCSFPHVWEINSSADYPSLDKPCRPAPVCVLMPVLLLFLHFQSSEPTRFPPRPLRSGTFVSAALSAVHFQLMLQTLHLLFIFFPKWTTVRGLPLD